MATAYTVEFTAGNTILVYPETVNTDTNITLIGRNDLDWGQMVNDNLVHLLENFASAESTPGVPAGTPLFDPAKAVKGQIWFNTTQNKIMVFDGTAWDKVGSAGVVVNTTAPGVTTSGDLWWDQTVNQLKVYVGSSWISVTQDYVRLDGTTAMVGPFNAGGLRVTNVATPTTATDAVTKAYADSISGSATSKVDKAGDTMTGFLTLNADPTSNLYAATKQYVDNSLTTTLSSYYNMTTADSRFVNASGDTMSGFLTLSADPTSNLHAATKQYVDAHSGGTPTLAIAQGVVTVVGSVSSKTLVLPAGTWTVFCWTSAEAGSFSAISLTIDGTVAYTSSAAGGDPAGTSTIPLFGVKTAVSGGRTITCSFNYGIGFLIANMLILAIKQ